jgi:hypothetical protein
MGPGATRPTPGARLAWRALGGTAVAAGLFGCVDLFHSTDFGVAGGVCDDAGVCVAPDAGGDGGGVKKRDGGADARVGDGGVRDGTVDHGGTGDGGRDGGGSTDGSVGPDAGDAGVDSGTDFCTAWTPAVAASHAEQACRLLGACVGNFDLNEYGVCYTNARLAYDCSLNPNQHVRGALHAYWDALSKATSCGGVLDAIFPAGVPTCASSGCGAGSYGNVVTICADGGGFTSAVNCQMRGYTCVAGVCGNGGSPCTGAGESCGGAKGNTLRACQTVENEAGTGTVMVDVGRDCTNFGGGNCVQSGGTAGCLPNDASAPCAPSSSVTCALTDGGAVVTGCASGFPETIPCSAFAAGTTCDPDGGWAAASQDLAGGCFNGSVLGVHAGATGKCMPSGGFQDNAGPNGVTSVACVGVGFIDGGCVYSATNEPYCPR